MAVTTKILIDTSEYDRLKKIETEYKNLLNVQKGGKKNCNCNDEDGTCSCKTIPLSQIINMNEKSHSLEPPTAGILPNITNPNDALTEQSSSGGNSDRKKNSNKLSEEFSVINWPKDDSKWYYLGRFE